jgi:Fe-S cluster assembly protein SufD
MTARTITDDFLAAFAHFERDAAAAGPSWLRQTRQAARDRLAEQGLPRPRDEEWKYTSIAPIQATHFDLAADPAVDEVVEASIGPFLMGGPSSGRLVFVNGRYSAGLSDVRPWPAGVRIGSLGEALLTEGALLRQYLGDQRGEAGDGFTALNTAFWLDGALVHVPAGVRVEEPLHLLFVATAPGAASVAHPRSLIVLERGSQAIVVESYVAVSGGTYLTNAVTDVVVGEGAVLDHYRVQRESQHAFHVGRTQVRQERDSQLSSCSIAFGGRLVRNDVHAVLGGEGAHCALNGLYVVGGRQHTDTHTVVDHAKPQGTSRQLYKGVLDGNARGVFNGRIIVRPGAQRTDAHQTNKNLLLSDGVEVDSKPQLEIFADDVKCSHGAADGQLAADAIFYLKSRGLAEATARTLLTYGFASDVLGRIRADAIRTRLEALLMARLRGGQVTEEGEHDNGHRLSPARSRAEPSTELSDPLKEMS